MDAPPPRTARRRLQGVLLFIGLVLLGVSLSGPAWLKYVGGGFVVLSLVGRFTGSGKAAAPPP